MTGIQATQPLARYEEVRAFSFVLPLIYLDFLFLQHSLVCAGGYGNMAEWERMSRSEASMTHLHALFLTLSRTLEKLLPPVLSLLFSHSVLYNSSQPH